MRGILITLAAGLAFTSAQANILFNETFTYPDGSLTATSGGLWAAHSGAGSTPVLTSSGQALLAQGSGSREDVNRSAGSVMGAGQTWYAGFDVTVSGNASTPVYFAHFQASSSIFGSRVFVTNSASGGDFRFALSGASGTAQAGWASDSDFDSTYRLVISYNYDSGESKLWVNPTLESDPALIASGFALNAMNAFGLRQAAGDSTQAIDNLIVATDFSEALTGIAVPEPSSMTLALAAGIGIAGWRVRRKLT